MGQPMLSWTVDAALKSQMFDKVVVSTDNQEIADIALAAGAQVPFLRARYADAHSTVSEAVYEALVQSELYWQTSFDVVCQLMPNCPLRGEKEIRLR